MQVGQPIAEGPLLHHDDPQADEHLGELREHHRGGGEVHGSLYQTRVAHADDEEGVLDGEGHQTDVLHVARIW